MNELVLVQIEGLEDRVIDLEKRFLEEEFCPTKSSGITLRDQFVMNIIPILMGKNLDIGYRIDSSYMNTIKTITERAYLIADEMLRARL